MNRVGHGVVDWSAADIGTSKRNPEAQRGISEVPEGPSVSVESVA
jgi:hypothetical protein